MSQYVSGLVSSDAATAAAAQAAIAAVAAADLAAAAAAGANRQRAQARCDLSVLHLTGWQKSCFWPTELARPLCLEGERERASFQCFSQPTSLIMYRQLRTNLENWM